jgi:hypothetical protein
MLNICFGDLMVDVQHSPPGISEYGFHTLSLQAFHQDLSTCHFHNAYSLYGIQALPELSLLDMDDVNSISLHSI